MCRDMLLLLLLLGLVVAADDALCCCWEDVVEPPREREGVVDMLRGMVYWSIIHDHYGLT